MQNFDDITRATPNLYLSDKDSLKNLDELLSSFKNPIIITGEKSYEAFLAHKQSSLKALRYDKTASEENINALAKEAKEADLIVGIGGGKVLDTAKGVAESLNAELITIPTILGTCAATTPIAAVYTPKHEFKKVGYYKRTPFACVADLNLLIHSPKKYLLGGIGDTLAKFYEAYSIIKLAKKPLEANVELGLAASKITKDILLKDTQKALKDFDEKQISPEFKRISDTILNISAAVGCFACKMGRSSGAHAIHNALSMFESTHKIEHGVKVAYGLLVQLAVFKEFDELERLRKFCKENGFIYSFKALNIQENKNEAILKIAHYASSKDESFIYAKPDISPKEIIEAINFVEDLGE
ncbi:oxidoreductase [Campylobacter sp. MIT 99-7217]|uniref:iron-containing alcohol dehydrogenase family protein n=1 Tax=Campylobacter sp. MIT 99-7217 TaxID=535091 RepID=UPI00115AC8D8|nr:iron-containing alcohol dehydrogenase family protein [Campylobacter sp. MIT 99-7217]TQR33103.1 oxidoreductase [Campylobacter sp. MIT 99-7217]